MSGIISNAMGDPSGDDDAPSLPPQNVNGMVLPNDEVMAGMPWSQLSQLRIKAAGNTPAEMAIAPYEHRAYARENATANPVVATTWALMPPAYQVAKLVGLTDQNDQSTPPSFKQFVQGEIGVGEGIGNSIANGIAALFK